MRTVEDGGFVVRLCRSGGRRLRRQPALRLRRNQQLPPLHRRPLFLLQLGALAFSGGRRGQSVAEPAGELQHLGGGSTHRLSQRYCRGEERGWTSQRQRWEAELAALGRRGLRLRLRLSLQLRLGLGLRFRLRLVVRLVATKQLGEDSGRQVLG